MIRTGAKIHDHIQQNVDELDGHRGGKGNEKGFVHGERVNGEGGFTLLGWGGR